MTVEVCAVDFRLRLALINDFLHLLVLLLHLSYVAIDDGKSFFKVVDLVIEDLVVGMDSHLTIDKSIDGLGHLAKVLRVELFKIID